MDQSNKTKVVFSSLAIGLFTLIVLGLIWFFFLGPSAPVGLGWYLFSFAAGLSMIVLPCTLPLAFVIVPLSMGKGAVKGFGIALSFGIGVALTLSLYGVLAAILGKVAIGTLGAPLEVVKNWLYFVAGFFAYLFALGELGLIKFRMPSYSGAAPAFIQKQQDYIKALLLGLFLGNVGVGCPHPATPVILTRIAASGDIFYGWLLFFTHAVGRILPLLLLALLAILGVNALSWLVARKDKIERATGWGMVFVAGFILVLGLFTHDWWVNSGQHTFLEEITQEERFLDILGAKLGTGNAHNHGLATGTGLFGLPLRAGDWVLVFLWLIPVWWYYAKKKKEKAALADPEKVVENKVVAWRFWLNILLSVLLVITFVYYLPLRFLYNATFGMEQHKEQTGMMTQTEGHVMDQTGMMTSTMGHGEYHEEGEIKEGLVVNFDISPTPVFTGAQEKLNFFVNEKPTNSPVSISDLEIDHEKVMHVIGVRSDLNEFFHVHPKQAYREVLQGSGKTAQKVLEEIPGLLTIDHTFSKPGVYKIWSEVKKDSVDHTLGHSEINVEGEGERVKKEVNFSRNVTVGNYQVSFATVKTVVKGKNQQLSFDVHTLTGGEVELDDYLGASMHLSIIKDDLKQLIHTHPAEQGHSGFLRIPEARAHGGEEENIPMNGEKGNMPMGGEHGINFQVVLPEAGLYKAFAQFRPKGIDLSPDEALTAEFWIKVEEKEPFPLSPWWINLIWSSIAIVVLSLVVKKYLKVG